MKIKLPWYKRALRLIAIFLLAALFLLYIVLPAAIGIAAVFPAKQPAGEPPDGFAAVTLTTDDSINLQAWHHPSENGATIILLHGASSSREAVRPFASMLARHGYGVLAVDLRGHGSSPGPTNRLGWQGTADVGAAVRFLQDRPDVQAIGALGLSMGGEALLGAASTYPVIQAIVADGATRRSMAELMALESERPLVRNFTARVMFAAVQLISRQEPPKPLLESMTQAQDTAFLFIAGGEERLEVAFNQLFADTLGGRAMLWIAPNAGHTTAFERYPEEYEQRVIAFFNTALRRPTD